MKTQLLSTRPAGLAIAAALAFTPLSLSAQEAPVDAAPPPVDVAPPADPAPTIVVPEAAVPPAEPAAEPAAPVIEAAPVEQAPVIATPRAAAPVRTAPRAAVAAPVAAPPVTAAAPVAAVPVEAAPSALPETAIAPLPADESAVARAPQRGMTDGQIALIVGGLAALALLGWGFVAIGRRRRPTAAVIEEPMIERPITPEPVAAVPMREPIAFAPRPAAPAPSLRHTGAAVALPRELPQSHEAREDLLNRMTDARPDRANPFTSPIQRRKRARLIMQCIGKHFDRPSRIDLSQYPENWPELQDQRYADAA